MSKLICNVGYIGEGPYKSMVNYKYDPAYHKWYDMLRRCYTTKPLKSQECYIGCTVDTDWHNYQNFAHWYYTELYPCEDKLVLDKDILYKHNTIYSERTCLLVPSKINNLFPNAKKVRGKYPVGVSKHRNKYQANCCDGTGKTKYLGSYTSVEQAFMVYKNYKQQLIKQEADKYKTILPNKVYEAIINYEIDIND